MAWRRRVGRSSSTGIAGLTAGPATVKGNYVIDLPRPRNVTEIRFDARFVELYHEIWEDLRNEVMISYERSKQVSR